MSCSEMKSLVYWEKPVPSLVVFLPVFLVLLALSCWSLIYVSAWCALLLLLGVPGLKVFGLVLEKLGKPNPLGNPVEVISKVDLTVQPAQVESVLSSGVHLVNSASAQLKKIFLFEDVLSSVKFGLVCYTLTFIGSCFNLMTLVLLAWTLAFTVPAIYIKNQETADALIAKAKVHIDLVKAKIYPQGAAAAVAAEEVKKDE